MLGRPSINSTVLVGETKKTISINPAKKKLQALGLSSDEAVQKTINKLPSYFNTQNMVNFIQKKSNEAPATAVAEYTQFYQNLLLVSLLMLRLVNQASNNLIKHNTRYGKTVKWAEEMTSLQFKWILINQHVGERIVVISSLDTFTEENLFHNFIDTNNFYKVLMTIRATVVDRIDKLDKYQAIAALLNTVVEDSQQKLVKLFDVENQQVHPVNPVLALEFISAYFQPESYGNYFQKDAVRSYYDKCVIGNWKVSQNFYQLLSEGLKKVFLIANSIYKKETISSQFLADCKLEYQNGNLLPVAEHDFLDTSYICELINKVFSQPKEFASFCYFEFYNYFTHLINCVNYCMDFEKNTLNDNIKRVHLTKKVFELMKIDIKNATKHPAKDKSKEAGTSNHRKMTQLVSLAPDPATIEASLLAKKCDQFYREYTQALETFKDFIQKNHTAQSKLQALAKQERNAEKVNEEKTGQYPRFSQMLDNIATNAHVIETTLKQSNYSIEQAERLLSARKNLDKLIQEQQNLIEEMCIKLKELNGTIKLTTNQIKAQMIQNTLTQKKHQDKGRRAAEEKSNHDENFSYLLQDAGRKIFYINKILSYGDCVLSTEVKHFAFLYNIHWCLHALKSINMVPDQYQSISASQLFHYLISNHGFDMETYPQLFDTLTEMNASLEMKFEEAEHNWEWNFNDEQRKKFLDDSPAIFERLSILCNPTTTEKNSNADMQVAQRCVNYIKAILARVSLSTDDRINNPLLLLAFYQFEIQSLRMLVLVCGELYNPNLKTMEHGLKIFLQQCRQSCHGNEPCAKELPTEATQFITELADQLKTLAANKTAAISARTSSSISFYPRSPQSVATPPPKSSCNKAHQVKLGKRV